MGSLIRAFDWTATGLGPTSGWPAHLKSAVGLMLPARVPIVLFWGQQFVALYNDAYAPTIGDSHPAALGTPARENWSGIEPLLRQVLATGETVSAKDRPFTVKRHGHPETGYFDMSCSPVHDASGGIDGVLCILEETTQRLAAEQHLAAIVESSDDAIVSKNLDGIISSWNVGAERLFGYTADEVVGKSITILIPEDRQDEEPDILARLRKGERVEHFETIRKRKDGSLIDISLTISPVRNDRGDIIGASKIARDITGRRAAETLQRTLLREMKHRLKNNLSTVLAIARQSFHSDGAESEDLRKFEARLLALAKGHDLLTREKWDGADLKEIVAHIVTMHGRQRFAIDGPDLRLSPKSALALNLALHELAVNAAKYGALSISTGKVSINWRIQHGASPRLIFCWQEQDGPEVAPPSRRGFGSQLIERLLALELKGEVKITYAPAGIICEIVAPLSAEWEEGTQI
ncbi:MAG: PAS domain S-box protein [Xanthobacteraceae bacterium]|nr:PAS domain S-box protein [Xanthobacteraceae bacterium]